MKTVVSPGDLREGNGGLGDRSLPLRIMFLVDSLRVGGKERQICELLKGLKRTTSIEPIVVTMGSEQFYVPDVEKLGVPLFYLLRKIRWDPTVLPRLLRIVRQFRPQIIHTNSEMAMSYAWPVARVMGLKLINATIRNAFSGRGFRWQWHRAMLQLADARVGNSRAGFESRKLSPDSRNNYVIYNGIDMLRFQTGIGDQSRSFPFGNGKHKVVGMVAEFSDYKDFPTFIGAAQLVLQRRNDVAFVAVGGGKNLEACRQLVPRDENRILFLGQREDVELLVQQMDIGVLCTFTEGISNSLMEFMAARKPVIATNGGGSSELVVDGQSGFLVPPTNPNIIAEKIELLLSNPKKAQQMGDEAYRRLQDCFSLEALVENHIRMYQAVLAA